MSVSTIILIMLFVYFIGLEKFFSEYLKLLRLIIFKPRGCQYFLIFISIFKSLQIP